jgi:hypothetical protein
LGKESRTVEIKGKTACVPKTVNLCQLRATCHILHDVAYDERIDRVYGIFPAKTYRDNYGY